MSSGPTDTEVSQSILDAFRSVAARPTRKAECCGPGKANDRSRQSAIGNRKSAMMAWPVAYLRTAALARTAAVAFCTAAAYSSSR